MYLYSLYGSQNILLDVGFIPKLADCGFVTPLPMDVGSTSMITVAGTVALAGTRGYLPPEFADGKRGVKSDVYCYGIVSTEMIARIIIIIFNYVCCFTRCVWRPILDCLSIQNLERNANWSETGK